MPRCMKKSPVPPITEISLTFTISDEVDRALVIRTVEHKRESEPRSESILGIINIKALSPPNWFRVKVIIQCDGVIKNYDVPEVELRC